MKIIFFFGTVLILLLGAGCKNTVIQNTVTQFSDTFYTDQNETLRANINTYMESVTKKQDYIGNDNLHCSSRLYGYDNAYAYTWVLCAGFTNKNGNLEIGTASSIPTRLTYEQTSYKILDYVQPRDGDLYGPDLEKLFPKNLYNSNDFLNPDVSSLKTDVRMKAQTQLADERFWVGSEQQLNEVYKKMNTTTSPISSLMSMSTPPEWQTINLEPDLIVSIPYSSKWKINDLPVKPFFDDNSNPEKVRVVRFGRYLADMSLIPEYFITISPKDTDGRIERAKRDGWLNVIMADAQDACPISGDPLIQQIGPWKGVNFLEGGAKGCGTEFSFVTDKYVVEFIKVYPIGQDKGHLVTPEMKKIISSIKETN